jgi:hypothetical protein
MVRAVAAAACGQARIVVRTGARVQRGRKRGQAEEQDEENGKRAPHLGMMVHDLSRLRNGMGISHVAIRYHHGIRSASGTRQSNPLYRLQ